MYYNICTSTDMYMYIYRYVHVHLQICTCTCYYYVDMYTIIKCMHMYSISMICKHVHVHVIICTSKNLISQFFFPLNCCHCYCNIY